MNIGLLEDNPAIIEYLTTALKMAGHTVRAYTQGSSLLETILIDSDVQDPLPYDVLIIDLFLPGELSGLTVLERIQQVIPLSKLPTIIISAGSQDELEHAQKRFPGVPILRKPFKMNILLDLVESPKLA